MHAVVAEVSASVCPLLGAWGLTRSEELATIREALGAERAGRVTALFSLYLIPCPVKIYCEGEEEPRGTEELYSHRKSTSWCISRRQEEMHLEPEKSSGVLAVLKTTYGERLFSQNSLSGFAGAHSPSHIFLFSNLSPSFSHNIILQAFALVCLLCPRTVSSP